MKSKTENIKLSEDVIPFNATHPGVLLREEIEYRGIKQKNLADDMKIAPNVLSEIIHGKRNITPELSIKLEKVLGIDAAFWMRLQVNYEINNIRIKHRNEIKEAKLSKKEKTSFFNRVFKQASLYNL